jgi:hypothetical protein
MRLLLILLLSFSIHFLLAQHRKKNIGNTFSRYVGKYETNGFVVQVVLNNHALLLVVPGAPLQSMIPVTTNKFKSEVFNDSFFLFIEKEGKIVQMVNQNPGASITLTKVSDTVDPINPGDSLLTRKKLTDHFSFLYSDMDSISVDLIASRLERSYHKILTDFKMKSIPVTIVRVYPSVKAFHEGINFPDAPPNILATAFGKSDIRMPSPNSVGSGDSLNLINNIAHEFTHCVHLNIDYAPNNPRWLWEGVAMFEADWFINPKEIDVIKNRQFPSLISLSNGLEYELGYVIIEAIKDIWGFDAVIDLIKKRGDVPSVLQLSQEQFEEKIYAHIYKKYVQN